MIYGNQSAQTGPNAVPILRLDAGPHTGLTAGGEIKDLYIKTARTVQWSTGTLATQRFIHIESPTLGFVGASTATDVSLIDFDGNVVAGTNASITNNYGLRWRSRNVGSGTTNAWAASFSAPTGATNNFSAEFIGAIRLNGSVGTSGQVLTSGGNNASATWTTIAGSISGLTTNRIPYATSSSTIGDNSGLTFNSTGAIVTAGGLVLSSTPTLNDAATQMLSRNSSTGAVEYTTIASSNYTPTLTNISNLDSSVPYICQYMRVGSRVTVSGIFEVNPTLTATLTELGISLPIASTLTSGGTFGGVASSTAVAGMTGGIVSDTTNDRATLKFVATDVNNTIMAFTFTYYID